MARLDISYCTEKQLEAIEKLIGKSNFDKYDANLRQWKQPPTKAPIIKMAEELKKDKK